jgi:hypothetical protein
MAREDDLAYALRKDVREQLFAYQNRIGAEIPLVTLSAVNIVMNVFSAAVAGLTTRVEELESLSKPSDTFRGPFPTPDDPAAKSFDPFATMDVRIPSDPVLPDVRSAMSQFGKDASKPKTRADAEEICCFWGVNDPEDLSSEDPDEAIGDYLESLKREDWPETLSLHGFVRKKLEYRAGRLIDQMLEDLDDEYSGEGRESTEPNPAMEAAEKAFIADVLAEYKPWACEEVWQEDVNVLAWVTAHQPDWLEDEKAT